MLKANIAVLVSGGGTNLQAIIDAEKSGIIKSGTVKIVISIKEDAYALKRAEKENIETAVVTKDGRTRQEFEGEIIKILDSHAIDLIVLAGFMCILSENFTPIRWIDIVYLIARRKLTYSSHL